MSNVHRFSDERRALFLQVRKNKRVKVKKWDNGLFFVTMLRNNQIVDNYYQALKWIIAADELLYLPKFKRQVRIMFFVGDNGLAKDPTGWQNKKVTALNTSQKAIALYHLEFINQIKYLQCHQGLSDDDLTILRQWIHDKVYAFMAESINHECDYWDFIINKIKEEII